MSFRTPMLVAFALVAGSANVRAAPAVDPNKAQAQKLVSLAGAAFQKGDFPEALVNFRAAYDLYPSPRVLYDLGMCHLRLDHSVDAASAFQKYLDAAQTDASLPNIDTARTQLAALSAKLARLDVVIDEPDTQATVDGAAIKAGATFLNPGDHTLIWTAPGASTSTKKMTLAAGSQTSLTLHPKTEAPPAADLPAWQPGPAGDLAIETSAFLKQTAYRNPGHFANEGSDTGACGKGNIAWDETHQGRWSLDAQRVGYDAIAAGIANERQDLIDRGRKIFDWGFRQQKVDGSFDCADALHTTVIFLEAAAHAALLLEASPLRAANHAWVESITPRVAKAAHWLVVPANEKSRAARDRPLTHRAYLTAAAIGEAGVLVGDPDLIERSWASIRTGIAAQDPSGFNPEKGVADASDEALGLLYALTYDEVVATAKQRPTLTPAIAKGFTWLKSQVRSDGTFGGAEGSHPGKGIEKDIRGKSRAMNYTVAYHAAFAWATITRDPQWAELARQLVEGQQVERKSNAAAKSAEPATAHAP